MTWWIFQNMVITTALVIVVAAVCRFGRLGPVARHALWVLVLVKFVTPPIVVWPWAAPDPLGLSSAGVMSTVSEILDSPAASDDMWRASATSSPVPDATGAPTEEPVATVPVLWLLALWAIGSLCLAGVEGVRLLRLRRQVRMATPADPALAARVETLAHQLAIRPVPVVTVAGHHSPVVWGWGRPRLLWPAALSTECPGACVDGLLVHELAHVKRRDHLVGWIELAAGIVWWWNPLFWFVRSSLREQAELACDGWVISTLPHGRRAYAESLLALSVTAPSGAASLAVVGARATSRRLLERRLVMIMKGRTSLRLPVAGLCTLALIAAATLPAWATSPQAPPQPPLPPVVAVPQAPPPAPASRPQDPPPPPPVLRQGLRQAAPVNVQVKTPTPAAQRTLRVAVKPPARPAVLMLPNEGRVLVVAFDKEREAILATALQQITQRHDATIKALEALQDQFARDGKLDEAIAIRDYLRAGGPRTGAPLPAPTRVR